MSYLITSMTISNMLRALSGSLLVTGLLGCSMWGGGLDKPMPNELGVNVPILGVRQAWLVPLGSQGSPHLAPHINSTVVTVASVDGSIVAVNARTGSEVWRLNLGEPLAAGVGADGRWTAVITQGNELVALKEGREEWRQRIAAQVYTSPFVAGGRIFVLAADRSIMAFDAAEGHRLWSQPGLGDPLVLRQSGVLMAVGDNLIIGLSGRLAALNPDSGAKRWEVPLASPRGTNDVERLVELVGPASRVGESVCARAFDTAVGCVDTARPSVKWTQISRGIVGLGGDDMTVYGTQTNGFVTAWSRRDASRTWSSQYLQHRQLTAPLLLGRSVVIGDESGWVHFLSREDGAPLNRVATDESGIAVEPVAVADTLVVVTRKGNIYGFRPD